ncbi:MAG: N-acetylmuramoyl-L-alanine amidase [Puniceicoccales bacterium]|jgi:N-acetylmuramoyl-L-alanine amidase|nr:N-acetylmuramoyl-L-alanine amidase [Puniceicoccales bacterium]
MVTLKSFIRALPLLCAVFFTPNLIANRISIGKIADGCGLKVISSESFGGNGTVFSFKDGSKAFSFNKILMPLGFPATKQFFRIFIDESDYIHHIRPLLQATKYNYRKLKIIALDAGHGGEDHGTTSPSNKLKEKTLTMDICTRVEKLLVRRGYSVVLTRMDDIKIPLEERAKIANAARADLFICIHFNSAPSVSASGIEVFVLPPDGQPQTDQRTSTTQDKYPGNKFDDLNVVLGYCLQSSLVNGVGAKDRGVKQRGFTVLRTLQCPGALVECGFLSNSKESAKIASEEYRNKLAHAIASAVEKFDERIAK